MTGVFISYAHADDQQMTEGAPGWVTGFAGRLQKAVQSKEGGGHIQVWMDHRLPPEEAVGAALDTHVTASAGMVVVLSPRYLESKWCLSELETFITQVGRGGTSDRVFLVEILPTERSIWPQALQSLSPVQFWSQPFDRPDPFTLGWPAPDATDKPYWNRLNELAHFLAQRVKVLSTASAQPPPARGRVWIAEPTDHVLDRWESLASALRQESYEVLPAAPSSYPTYPESDFHAALDADLSRAQLLVQLLGPHPGRRPSWAAASFTRLQADSARAKCARDGIPYLAWRAPEINLLEIANADHRDLLIGAIAGSFEEFRQQVLKRVAAPAAPAPRPVDMEGPITICVTADKADRELGASVRDMLFDQGIDVSLTPEPLEGQSPAQWRQDYETVLTESQGLVVLYGQAPPSWVQTQVQAAKKTLARVRKGTWGALLKLPPIEKPDHGLRMHNLMLLDCSRGLEIEPLLQFVQALRSNAHV